MGSNCFPLFPLSTKNMKNSRAGIEDGVLPAKMYVLQRFLESELQAEKLPCQRCYRGNRGFLGNPGWKDPACTQRPGVRPAQSSLSMNLASNSPQSTYLHLLPDPMTSLGSLFSEAVVKIIFSPYRLPTKGKPYRCRLSQKTQKVCLAVSTTSPPLPPTAPSLEPPPGLPLPVERQHLSSRRVVCSTSFLCFQSPPVSPPNFPRMHFLGPTPPSSLPL